MTLALFFFPQTDDPQNGPPDRHFRPIRSFLTIPPVNRLTLSAFIMTLSRDSPF
jgi:hypothetical protein